MMTKDTDVILLVRVRAGTATVGLAALGRGGVSAVCRRLGRALGACHSVLLGLQLALPIADAAVLLYSRQQQ